MDSDDTATNDSKLQDCDPPHPPLSDAERAVLGQEGDTPSPTATADVTICRRCAKTVGNLCPDCLADPIPVDDKFLGYALKDAGTLRLAHQFITTERPKNWPDNVELVAVYAAG